jgi:putative hydrolase of the HAD superfamily/5'-nucleotidase
MKILDLFSVLVLDMGSTFMFGEDRFGPGEDFHRTYRNLGGARFGREEVHAAIQNCHHSMLRFYNDPESFDDFPSLAECLRRHSGAPETELALLEQVFAFHECGQIPHAHAALLRRLKQTHRLGLVSNIWSGKESFLAEFDRAGISDVFECKIFSSDSRSIKPSPTLFRRALESFRADARVLFIGDSLDRDIKPAKELGMATAWISPNPGEPSGADYMLTSLLQLEDKLPDN